MKEVKLLCWLEVHDGLLSESQIKLKNKNTEEGNIWGVGEVIKNEQQLT